MYVKTKFKKNKNVKKRKTREKNQKRLFDLNNIKSLQSSLIRSVYFLNEIISVNVSKTKTDVFNKL